MLTSTEKNTVGYSITRELALGPVLPVCTTANLDESMDFERLPAGAKWSFVTRNVGQDDVAAVGTRFAHQPGIGDLIVAQVDRVLHQNRLQLANGRRSQLFPGDYVVVAYANRYAPDQYEALIPKDLGPCHLVASGGIAAQAISQSTLVGAATRISPLGYLLSHNGKIMNLRDYPGISAFDRTATAPHKPVIVVAGTSMNSGKTTTVSAIVRGLSLAGKKVAALKVTGTGAGNDMWSYSDAGAHLALDFTDAGYPSTYKIGADKIESCCRTLIDYAKSRSDIDVIVVEVADGLLFDETLDLLRTETLRSRTDRLIFAAGEALGAYAGVEMLRRSDISVAALSGVLSASRLAAAEAEAATQLKVLTRQDLESPEVIRWLP